MRGLIVGLGLLMGVSQVAHAALFGDDEARRKIADLQQQVQTQNQATQAAIDELKKNQQALEQRYTQSLTDMLGKIDALNQQISRLQGQLEVANHNIDMTQQRQKDLYADTDGRLRKLESGAPAATTDATQPASGAVADTSAAPASTSESKDLDAANALLQSSKFKESFDAYQKFLQTYPASTHAADAMYGLGFSQFSLKNYKAAIATQQKLLKQYPDSAKAPEASFNIANSQIQLADIDGAKKTLRDLISQYPKSDVIPRAQSRLKVLESIKR
ncbi:tol-pal system protein YbgF [Methylovorus mays]|uniref:tol-pal system protein YbgF n=1 Tax=Methylovorus mays TaxID=184077 RepID=UPI001E5CB175|nr:tol-pal system protein YbgF [Methylovorus mays]MCB5207913.1 tol-pal system protein YbgF [Methylovorus mays]